MARPKKPLTPAQQITALNFQLAALDIDNAQLKFENESLQKLVKETGALATDHQNISTNLFTQRDRMLIALTEIANETKKIVLNAKSIEIINRTAVNALNTANSLYKNDN